MDELNLADRFGGKEDERPMPRKKKRRTIPGTGMEKPTVRFEDEDEMGFGPLAEGLDDEEEDEDGLDEEGNPFDAILKDMQGESASAKRAREKRKKMKANPRRFGDDSLRAEFAARPGEEL